MRQQLLTAERPRISPGPTDATGAGRTVSRPSPHRGCLSPVAYPAGDPVSHPLHARQTAREEYAHTPLVKIRARRLAALGRETALVALLDTHASHDEEERDDAGLLAALFKEDFPLSAEELRGLEYDRMLTHVIEKAKEAKRLPSDFGRRRARLILRMTRIAVKAAARYTPGPSDGKVVLNHEEQYSIWPADKENALGWTDAGKDGPKAECLDYIREVWTDMRPLSLRKKMEEDAKKREASEG